MKDRDPDSPSILSRFLDRQESESTRQGYRRDLQLFFSEFLGKEEVTARDASSVSRADIYLFLQFRTGQDKDTTVRRRATALLSCFRWLHNEGHLDNPPIEVDKGSGQVIQAALEEASGPPHLEDLPEEFFEPAPWLEDAFEHDLPQRVKLGEGEVLPLLKVPEVISLALARFSEKATEETGAGTAGGTSGPWTLKVQHPGHPLRVEIRHRPETDSIRLVIIEETLQKIRKRGPDPTFHTEAALKLLAFLWSRRWTLPEPLFAQLQQMAVGRPGREDSQKPQTELDAPQKAVEPASMEQAWEAASLEVVAVLAGPCEIRPGEKVEVSAQSPRSWSPADGLPLMDLRRR
jgi:hypothetical protein